LASLYKPQMLTEIILMVEIGIWISIFFKIDPLCLCVCFHVYILNIIQNTKTQSSGSIAYKLSAPTEQDPDLGLDILAPNPPFLQIAVFIKVRSFRFL
jgi:hypothetical protein